MRWRAHPLRALTPHSLEAAVLLNGVTLGLVTLTYPLLLAARGATKAQVTGLFVLDALVVMALNFSRLPRSALRRPGLFRVAQFLGAAGLALVGVSRELPLMYLGAGASMTTSLVFPVSVAKASERNEERGRTSMIASLRAFFTAGYVAGTGLFGLLSLLRDPIAEALRPAYVASACTLAAAVVLSFLPSSKLFSKHHDVLKPRDRSVAPGVLKASLASRRTSHSGAGWLVVPSAAAAIVFLKAADSMRSVYLPLYALHSGVHAPLISLLFLFTGVGKIAVLPLLGRLGDWLGATASLLVVCAAGVVSFSLVLLGRHYWFLLAAQGVYAVYAAGFQAVGMALLGSVLGEVARGAAVYTAVAQSGSLAGVLAPLAMPGYSSSMFLLAIASCSLAAGSLAVCRTSMSRLRRQLGTAAV